ncbi:uncharacterized protein C10orf67, mitochondrial-like isoform X2 [Dendronephthya gigantea]|uniref:uncharacterized protein C10orf67, mitochondrial-like isoform X2 n=1 Tax=Dendronephthya gigantea TaxID=151771 RepID=UPI00106BC866|nr:uncharacterized protein C10orf67, mitochondrial-like isoform X2 [Dendronephthya gigantea]
MADFATDNVFDRKEDSSKIRMLISPISDDYRPSISDKTRAGYFSQECASQTEKSDMVNIKEVTHMVQILVQDLSTLKKSLYFARHVLEADYKNKLEEKGLDLYCRVNDRILDLEKMHEERVKTIRRSFKQQLADAVVQISNENERIAIARLEKQERMADKKRNEELLKKERGKAAQQQEALLMMMKMQLKEQQERADRDLEEALMERYVPTPVESNSEEREHLVSQINELEIKLEDMDSVLEDIKIENKQLVQEVDDLSKELDEERDITDRLKQDIAQVNSELEREKHDSRRLLEKQKYDLERDYQNRIRKMKDEMLASSQKQMEDYKSKQKSKDRERDLASQRLLDEAMKKKTVDVVPDTEKDGIIRKLQQIEIKLTAEIAGLRKELDRVNKTWEMKVTILKQSIHALKDEAFLRATLQKQAARLHHASVTYASDGPVIIPRDPIPLNKRYRIIPPRFFSEGKDSVIRESPPQSADSSNKEHSGRLRIDRFITDAYQRRRLIITYID